MLAVHAVTGLLGSLIENAFYATMTTGVFTDPPASAAYMLGICYHTQCPTLLTPIRRTRLKRDQLGNQRVLHHRLLTAQARGHYSERHYQEDYPHHRWTALPRLPRLQNQHWSAARLLGPCRRLKRALPRLLEHKL